VLELLHPLGARVEIVEGYLDGDFKVVLRG